ncbi:hypothetical protein JJJ17_19850 [Paracoccus caeni]|uniref:Uncharacterized protein n=1 Tax=Paracoccus caeni TaxID=657651 RepID=A0A934SPR4_9RHOB|nr:hypothetical protein [Paracoccus caeni]MBK4218188.1 hypothetical protein [Paracoccus caeni]
MNPDLLRSLHPPRLPEAFAGWNVADLLAAFGVGLLLAALVLTILSPMLRRRVPLPGIAERISAAADLPPQERELALVRLLAERGGTLTKEQRQRIYTGKGGDPAALEAQIRRVRR